LDLINNKQEKSSMFRKYKNPRHKSGQSTVEYIVLVTAVVGCIILFMNGKDSVFQQKVNQTLDQATEGMVNKAGALEGSHTAASFNSASKITVDPVTAHPFTI
jgi:hypothetical protein